MIKRLAIHGTVQLTFLFFLSVCLISVQAAAPEKAYANTCLLNGTTYCGVMYHRNDTGYDPSIIIECDYGSGDTHRLAEYQHSQKYCKDMDRVYVRHDEELWCRYEIDNISNKYVDKKIFDTRGWHKWAGWREDGTGCFLTRD